MSYSLGYYLKIEDSDPMHVYRCSECGRKLHSVLKKPHLDIKHHCERAQDGSQITSTRAETVSNAERSE